MRFLNFMNTPTGRGIRIGGGLAIGTAGLVIGGELGTALAAFAVLPVATGAFGVCPINPLFGQPLRACSLPAERRARHA